MTQNEVPSVFGRKATEQIAKTVREVTRRMMNEQPHRARYMHLGGGGGSQRIRFTVSEMVCPDEYNDELYVLVEWTHYTGGCGKEPPGQDSYGLIAVYDACVLSYFTMEGIVGMSGSATYFYPKPTEEVPCEPRWIVDDICGQPECG